MRTGLVFDASVLIDIASVDVGILGLIQAHVAAVVIPVIVLGEVEALDEPTARALGLTLVESTTSQREEALARPRSLSFADYICFVTARDLGMKCVTNDGALANHCVANGVLVTRGLRPLINLVEVGQMTALREPTRRPGDSSREPLHHQDGRRLVRSGGLATPSLIKAYVPKVASTPTRPELDA